jgi:hypothetical protein
MVPVSRRRFLAGCGSTLAVVLAGCSSTDEPSDDDTPRFPEPDDILTDVETFTTRVDAELSRDESVVEFDSGEEDGEEQSGRFVGDTETAAAMQLSPAPDDADAALSFVRGTDFDDASIMHEEFTVSGCHEHALQYVELEPDNLSLRFCQVFRDPSVDCSLEESHQQVTLVRVPKQDDEQPRTYGAGHSSNCRLPDDHPAAAGGEDA